MIPGNNERVAFGDWECVEACDRVVVPGQYALVSYRAEWAAIQFIRICRDRCRCCRLPELLWMSDDSRTVIGRDLARSRYRGFLPGLGQIPYGRESSLGMPEL